MSSQDSILIIVDPTADAHPAIDRGMYLAKHCGMRAELFVCGYSPQLVSSQLLNPDKLDRAKHGFIDERKKWLASLAEPYVADGIDVTVSASWDHPLYEGIIRQVLHRDPRLVVKDTHFHSPLRRALFTNTDWHLIRGCPASLWLVRAGKACEQPVMLAAVDPLHSHDKPANLDARLLSEAFSFADRLGGAVHAFHAYNPFVDPDDPKRVEEAHTRAMQALVDEQQIPAERAHLRAGNTVELLPQVESEIGADVVVMGAVSRSRLEHAIVGSTAEQVLDRLSCDVLIVKPRGFVSPVTFKSAPAGVIYGDEED
jgi:universal stress protein E